MQEKTMRAEAEAEGGWEELQTWLKKRRNNQETEDRTMRTDRGRQHTTRQDKASNFVNKKKRKTKKKRKRREEHEDEPYVVRGACGQPQNTQRCQRRRQPVGNKRNEEIRIRKTKK